MREILFRGKNFGGEWEYGVPVFCGVNNELAFMKQMHSYDHQVLPETVGQYTGLTDKNGKKIFEGDIVNVWWEQITLEQVDNFQKYKAVIEFGNPNHLYSWGWQLNMIDDMPFNHDILLWVDMEEAGAFIEVIGNIHDNPELLNGGLDEEKEMG